MGYGVHGGGGREARRPEAPWAVEAGVPSGWKEGRGVGVRGKTGSPRGHEEEQTTLNQVVLAPRGQWDSEGSEGRLCPVSPPARLRPRCDAKAALPSPEQAFLSEFLWTGKGGGVKGSFPVFCFSITCSKSTPPKCIFGGGKTLGHLIGMEWQRPDTFCAKPATEFVPGLGLCGFCRLAPCSPETHRGRLRFPEPVGLLLPPSWEDPVPKSPAPAGVSERGSLGWGGCQDGMVSEAAGSNHPDQ